MALSEQLAQLAARHIAEEGLSYFEAKRKAAKQVGVAEHNSAMPTNAVIEQALREYQAEFMADTQPAELFRLRTLAFKWLNQLKELSQLNEPSLALAVGAVVNGTAGEHSPVQLQVYTDEFKEFEIGLLDVGIVLEFSEKKLDGAFYPVVVAQDHGVPIVMTVLPRLRYSATLVAKEDEHPQHANAAQLALMMNQVNRGANQ